jgi:hypothetical protein
MSNRMTLTTTAIPAFRDTRNSSRTTDINRMMKVVVVLESKMAKVSLGERQVVFEVEDSVSSFSRVIYTLQFTCSASFPLTNNFHHLFHARHFACYICCTILLNASF